MQGPVPTTTKGLMRRDAVVNLLNTGTTRTYANDRIAALSAPYATKTYVDTQDDTFVSPATVDTADALNIPLTARGVVNGVATLDGSSLVPLAQCPNLGVGIMKGPYGATSQIASDTSTTSHVPIATIDLATSGIGIPFKPLSYACAFVGQTLNSRGMLELRISSSAQAVAVGTIGTAADTAYASQTLIGQGLGRSYYNDYQSIACDPAGSTTGLTATAGLSASTHWVITLWLVSVGGGTVTVRTSNITTLSAYLLRTGF